MMARLRLLALLRRLLFHAPLKVICVLGRRRFADNFYLCVRGPDLQLSRFWPNIERSGRNGILPEPA